MPENFFDFRQPCIWASRAAPGGFITKTFQGLNLISFGELIWLICYLPMKRIWRKSTVWLSFEWINHNMRNNRICYVSCLQGEAMFFPNYGFSLGLQPHPTLSRGVVVLWFRLPTQSFRRTVLVFTNFWPSMGLHRNELILYILQTNCLETTDGHLLLKV